MDCDDNPHVQEAYVKQVEALMDEAHTDPAIAYLQKALPTKDLPIVTIDQGVATPYCMGGTTT
jgi:hypothetical protein